MEACKGMLEGDLMEEKRNILLAFSRDVKSILGNTLSKVIVYGSYARGEQQENSDIDIMLLTTLSDVEIEAAERKIFDLAFDYEMDHGVVINPVIKNEEHFNYWLGALPFYDNVKKDGVVIGE